MCQFVRCAVKLSIAAMEIEGVAIALVTRNIGIDARGVGIDSARDVLDVGKSLRHQPLTHLRRSHPVMAHDQSFGMGIEAFGNAIDPLLRLA